MSHKHPEKRTKGDIFSEIVVTEVIVERIVPRPWTHLLGAVCHLVHLGPAPLYPLAICSTNT